MRFFQNLLTVSSGTALTRILGFLRDMAIAATLGAGPVAEAFVLALRLPNIARRVLGEGAFNAAFIPLYLRMSPAKALHFTGLVFTSFMGIILLISALFMVAMPWVMPLFAPGFAQSAHFDLAVLLTRLAFPFLPFMAAMALFAALLNAHNRFVATSYAPAILNIVLLILLAPFLWQGQSAAAEIGTFLAIGVSVAGFLQAMLLYIAAKRAKLIVPLLKPALTPQVRLLFWRAVPSLVSAGIAQINILVGTIIATYQFSGVAWLYFADRLYQLPLGIIGIALGVVLLNALAEAKNTNNMALFTHLQNQALVLCLMLALPATLGLYMGAEVIVSVLFERGAFLAKDSFEAARALKGFALGLPAFVLIKIYANSYFASEEMGAPFKAALIGLVVNVILSLLLFKPLGVMGIALATSLSGYVTLVFLLIPLIQRGALTFTRQTLYGVSVSGLAAVLMSVTLVLFVPTHTFLGLTLFVGSGLLVYGAVLAFFHHFCLKLIDFKGFSS
jgi:putative peptidoglycan lipid II flippase